jgi:FMN phosphatase YigB (HAD superfamily)
VIFDLDGTLCDSTGARMFRSAGIQSELDSAGVSADRFDVAFEAAGAELASSWRTGRITRSDYNAARFRLCAERLGLPLARSPRLLALGQRRFEDGILEHVQWLPRADEGFQAVAARFPVAVLTNGTSRLQRAKVARLGIGPLLGDALFISDESGLLKPDLRAFSDVLARFGAKGETTVMVGDSVRNDTLPAARLGIRAILVSSSDRGQWRGETLRTVGNLPALIARGLE